MVLDAKNYPAGTVLCRRGDVQPYMVEILQGHVGIYADYGLPTQRKLTTLTEDSATRHYGEMGLLDGAPRSASAVAETDCVLLEIGQEHVEEYFAANPDVLLALLGQLSSRIEAMGTEYLKASRALAESQQYIQTGTEPPTHLQTVLSHFAQVWHNHSIL